MIDATERNQDFARFLDRAEDVRWFAPHYPQWVVIQEFEGREVNWLIEVEDRARKGTDDRDAAMTKWCERVSQKTGRNWRFVRVDAKNLDPDAPTLRAQLIRQAGRKLDEASSDAASATLAEILAWRDEGRR